MQVFVLKSVFDFIENLEEEPRADMYRLIKLLEKYGHDVGMPHAKPIGQGLHELRRTGRPQYRMLYGFCQGRAMVVYALKKQQRALQRRDVLRAQKLLRLYCGS